MSDMETQIQGLTDAMFGNFWNDIEGVVNALDRVFERLNALEERLEALEQQDVDGRLGEVEQVTSDTEWDGDMIARIQQLEEHLGLPPIAGNRTYHV